MNEYEEERYKGMVEYNELSQRNLDGDFKRNQDEITGALANVNRPNK